MSIPTSQLETWSNQGAKTTSSQIYNSIKACLNAEASKIASKLISQECEIYLQGSYVNDTNIYGDSDVDIIVQLHSTWNRDLSALNEYERQLYLDTYPNATYLWENFYADVLDTLRKYYGKENVNTSGKVPKVNLSNSYKADIVVAIDYRIYKMFQGDNNKLYIEGLKFYMPNSDNRMVINYPKYHYRNGVDKNTKERTNGRYKSTVRMFKNIRNKLIDNKQITNKDAPSYFLECLLYNVPDDNYSTDYSQTFCNIINYLYKTNLDNFLCQNELDKLFGDSHEQWQLSLAKSFISESIKLWKNW